MINIGFGILAFGVCIFVIKLLNQKQFVSLGFKFLGIAFGLRILAGLTLTYIYTYYYPDRTLADTFRYFDDSYYLHQLLFENPKQYFAILSGIDAEFSDSLPFVSEMNNWFPAQRTSLYNDNRTVIRINTVLRWLSFGSYYFHMVSFAFMGFMGQLFVYKAFEQYFQHKKKAFAYIVFFIPSLVFWSSGVLKEGPLLLIFGYLLYLLEKISRLGWNKKRLSIVLLLFLILFHLKFYVALMIIPVISAYWAIRKWENKKVLYLIIANYSVYFLLAVLWHFVRWKWSLFTVFKWKKSDFEGLGKIMEAKSVIPSIYPLEDNPISFLINLPLGLFNALFRPFIWESYSPLILFSALENTLIIAFAGICIYFRKKNKLDAIRICFITYSISLLTIIGMVTPIMGSLVRYKIPALPFLLLFFLLILDTKKITEKYPSLKL